MSSNRFQVQQLIEQVIGCGKPEDMKSYKAKFESLVVNPAWQSKLIAASRTDTAGLYFKALLSISEALLAISRGHHSWPVVKLYYSVFYLMRCTFAARSLVMVKCSGIYTLGTTIGASPIKRDKGTFQGQAIRGDHKSVLAIYINDVGASDTLLSNKVGSKDTVFEWMMNKREEVHYRAPTFFEPDFRTFHPPIFHDRKLSFWINQYLSDADYLYCFQEEHCCLATALKFAQQTKSELAASFSNELMMSEEQVGVIKTTLLDTGVYDLPGFRKLFEI